MSNPWQLLVRGLWNNAAELVSATTAPRLGSKEVRRALRPRLSGNVGVARICTSLRQSRNRIHVVDDDSLDCDVTIDCDVEVRVDDDTATGRGRLLVTLSHMISLPKVWRCTIAYREVHIGSGAGLAGDVAALQEAVNRPGFLVAAGAVLGGEMAANGRCACVPAPRVKELAP